DPANLDVKRVFASDQDVKSRESLLRIKSQNQIDWEPISRRQISHLGDALHTYGCHRCSFPQLPFTCPRLPREWADCTGREGIFPLLKCTSTIRQLAYDIVPDFLDECLQMSTKTSRLSLDHFCTFVPEIFDQYLRKPTMTDVVKLYQHHEENHGFLRMLGSLDCTDWECFGCPYAHKGQYVRRDHGPNPFILLKLLRHKTYGYGMLSLVFLGYYLIDEICLELAPLVKAIPEPSHDDCKRIRYKEM
ncbi:ALP1-like protein isoform X1, partial [Tanacetum coccineum]